MNTIFWHNSPHDPIVQARGMGLGYYWRIYENNPEKNTRTTTPNQIGIDFNRVEGGRIMAVAGIGSELRFIKTVEDAQAWLRATPLDEILRHSWRQR